MCIKCLKEGSDDGWTPRSLRELTGQGKKPGGCSSGGAGDGSDGGANATHILEMNKSQSTATSSEIGKSQGEEVKSGSGNMQIWNKFMSTYNKNATTPAVANESSVKSEASLPLEDTSIMKHVPKNMNTAWKQIKRSIKLYKECKNETLSALPFCNEIYMPESVSKPSNVRTDLLETSNLEATNECVGETIAAVAHSSSSSNEIIDYFDSNKFDSNVYDENSSRENSTGIRSESADFDHRNVKNNYDATKPPDKMALPTSSIFKFRFSSFIKKILLSHSVLYLVHLCISRHLSS
jgi:hypothetical protein